MKTRSAMEFLTPVYLVLSAAGAVFYCLADFGNPLPTYAAMLWLLLLAVTAVAMTAGKKDRVLPWTAALMTALQIPMLLCWATMDWAVFYLFSGTYRVGAYGAVFHAALFALGLAIALRGLLRKGGSPAASL